MKAVYIARAAGPLLCSERRRILLDYCEGTGESEVERRSPEKPAV